MKKLIFLLNLLLALNCSAQTYDELKDIFYFTSKKLDAARDSINALKRLDSVILIQKQQIQKDSVIIKNDSIVSNNYQKQIDMISDELYKKDEENNFEFRGFYLGISPYCVFDSSIIKNSIWSNLKYNFTGTFKFSFLKKLDLSCGIEFPLAKENPYLKINIEWRVFK